MVTQTVYHEAPAPETEEAPDADFLFMLRRTAVYAKAEKMAKARAIKAQSEHPLYEMKPGAGEGEFSLRSPNRDETGRRPWYAVNILDGTCTCPDSQTHVARANAELESVDLPATLCCCHIAVVVEKLAAEQARAQEEEAGAEAVPVATAPTAAKGYGVDFARRRAEDFG